MDSANLVSMCAIPCDCPNSRKRRRSVPRLSLAYAYDEVEFAHPAIVVAHPQGHGVGSRHGIGVEAEVCGGEREYPARARMRIRSDSVIVVSRGGGGSPVPPIPGECEVVLARE